MNGIGVKLAAIGVAVAAGCTVAGNASAYSITGGSYAGTFSGNSSFTAGGVYVIECGAASSSISGFASGAASTNFSLVEGNCSFFGLPATVTHSGVWFIGITGGPDAVGWYTGDLHIPAISTTTYGVPMAGCTVTVTGTQGFSHGINRNRVRARNVTPTGVTVEYEVNSVAYTASGCPFLSGSDGVLRSGWFIDIPGISIS